MTRKKRVGTVAELSPKRASEETLTTSPTSSSEVGTVGTVFPYCTYVRAGMDIERARADFPENGLQLSPTVPTSKGERWDVNELSIPFGVGKKLGTVTAETRRAAEIIARQNYGESILVSISGGRPRRRRQLPRDLGSTRGDR